MAITAPTKTTDTQFAGFLRPELSAPIFEEAYKVSVVQQLVQQVPLGINGQAIPVVTGKMSAGWVTEGGQKPASNAAVGLKTIEPKKIAAIAVVSAEVVRANPANYMNLLRPQIGEAFALAFDAAALYDRGPDGTAGGGPFSTWLSQTTKAVDLDKEDLAAAKPRTVHSNVVAGLRVLVDRGKKLTGFALDDSTEPLFLDATDRNGRPIYIETPLTETTQAAARPGRLINRPSYMNELVAEPVPATVNTKYTVAFGGNWRQAAWGVVGGISYDVSTEATVTINGQLTSLWEKNLVAIRAEAEYGFLVNDPEAFVRYQYTTPAA
ncbi:phage major capsid protein [Actinocrispum wychmicini]|uniref:HK97 family phage major capsid protein n=1 Tax=Actinocrispum wychmicini TaxID=1213861 RepID=A0A4R2JEZ5_9PSEU|nr:phage major capsid protein [Actinocrispum wychmicini]TCO56792.1 HK97 family phage major capsid protein [Actinocrispum wychmicini]